VFLVSAPNFPAEKLKSRALFIVARDDGNDGGPRLPGIRAQYEKAPEPKELIVLDSPRTLNFFSKRIKAIASCARCCDASRCHDCSPGAESPQARVVAFAWDMSQPNPGRPSRGVF